MNCDVSGRKQFSGTATPGIAGVYYEFCMYLAVVGGAASAFVPETVGKEDRGFRSVTPVEFTYVNQ